MRSPRKPSYPRGAVGLAGRTVASEAGAPAPLKAFVAGLALLPPHVWGMALILAAGGAMCLFASVFPLSPTAPLTLDRIVGCALLGEAALLLRFARRLTVREMQLVAAGGTLTNSVLVAASTTDYGAALTAFAYLWVAVYAGQFLDRRAARAQAGLVCVALAVALALNGLPGMFTAWVVIATTVVVATETLSRLSARLEAQATTDPLTGLLNRNGLRRAAERAFAVTARAGMGLSVALIDLDGFKQVNDRDGHAAGDRLLAQLGSSWRDELDEGTEILARLGGDEFALVLPGQGAAAAQEVLARLRASSPIAWSAGVTEWRPGDRLEDCLGRADRALYAEKRRMGASVPA